MAESYAILGFGASGKSAYRYLSARPNEGIRVYVREAELSALRAAYPDIGFTAKWEELSERVLVRSPGVRPDLPPIRRALARGACLTGEAELFCTLCPAPVYAVTGSDGKTTTATLAARLLEAEGHTVHLGGNIGVPLLDRLGEIAPDHRVVLELSSFQLMTFTPALYGAAVTNLTENHLNWHTDMAEYRAAKRRILPLARRRVQNARFPLAPELSGLTFSAISENANYCVRHGVLMHGEEPLIPASELLLPGVFNRENLLCAAALTGAGAAAVGEVGRRFPGVPHRLEYCGVYRGVSCYNSSIDTTPARTAATLTALPLGCTVICGGEGKNLSWAPLAEALASYAARVVFTGGCGEEMEDALRARLRGASVPCHRYVADFEEAVTVALRLTPAAGTLVLSPAAASFDAFSSYRARGEAFRQILNRQGCGT